ncbi:type III pantothenate kinase [Lachnospiraceae bacterium NSJ-143]|nr:type III pantothenate kinase [Lachnospiraceae bacterium NSJ-143]
MLMALDVSNMNIDIGILEGYDIKSRFKMATNSLLTSDELGNMIYKFCTFDNVEVSRLENIIISSVVPNIMYSLTHGLKKYFCIEPVVIDSNIKSCIKLNMEYPRQLGNNRLVNLAAAYHFYGGPAIVIDYSTATTFDVVNGKGEFLTGITAPGIDICASALYKKTAQLPKIELKKPESIYCRNMVECIQAGIFYGHVGETHYIVNRIKKELGLNDIKIIATGGFAKSIDCANNFFTVYDPFLSFKGMRLLYDINKDLKGGRDSKCCS